jgi:predicted N-formylglutamate amidohydrolase
MFALSEAFHFLGALNGGGLLIVGDHASNKVPSDVSLGIEPALLEQHIALDIGVAAVARILVQDYGYSALLGAYSRLVVDLNRYDHEPGVIPVSSDGIAIGGNVLSAIERDVRLNRYYHPYHNQLQELIEQNRPNLILSLHSFTPSLVSKPNEARPWDIGVLYNQDDFAARLAIPLLEKAGLNVGDQQPYSGKVLNATMNRHAEANGVPYLGIEMRQDNVSNFTGQAKFAAILAATCTEIVEKLAL